MLDGEIVALDDDGRARRFQQLQGRIHSGHRALARTPIGRRRTCRAFIAFDLLRDGATICAAAAHRAARGARSVCSDAPARPILRLSEQVARRRPRALRARAASGWEGLIAKRATRATVRASARPTGGSSRSPASRNSSSAAGPSRANRASHFGALLLGVYERRHGSEGRRYAVYAGHVGTGFNERELARVMSRLLSRSRRETCPFVDPRRRPTRRRTG